MIKTLSKITMIGLAAMLLAVPAYSHAQDGATNPPAKINKKSHASVFKGKVTSVDAQAMTLTVGKRTFKVTAETKITKDSQPATLADAKVGEHVGGTYAKASDGTLTAETLHFGAKPKMEKSGE
jgi:hypothetical protein